MSRSDPALSADVEPAALTARIQAALNDARRLQAVHDSRLLDSPPEAVFDSLTALAASLLGVPVAFVSVMAADRDFYKSQHGFCGELAETRELSGRTFCHHTLLRDAPLVIEDTLLDPVFAAVPTVQTLGVRAYAGVPLRRQGRVIGSLCAIDMKPRFWGANEVEILVQLAASLQRELDLREALERTRVLAREREELVATVAHDLRAPLQVLSMGVQMIGRAGAGEEPPRRTLERMRHSLDAMQRLADELVSAARTGGAASLRLERLCAAQLARDAVLMMQPIAERRRHDLSVGALEVMAVQVDYGRMLRVLTNLIGNAVKYCPEGSRIRVEVAGSPGRASGDAEALHIDVSDNGPGIDPAHRARLFERGWQGGEGQCREDGAGLGLAIVRDIVDAHGGRVDLLDAPGRGTCVRVRLPVRGG